MKRLSMTLGVVLLSVSPLTAQSLQERIDPVRMQRRTAAADEQAGHDQRSIRERLRTIVPMVEMRDNSARAAFNWWSAVAQVPLVINWSSMELEGVDPEAPINLCLRNAPALRLLELLMQMASPDTPLIYDVEPWFAQVVTKQRANRHPVLRVYDVSDLTFRVPHFTNALSFDLQNALSNTSSGGGGRGGTGGRGGGRGRGLFGDDEQEEELIPTKEEMGQELAQLVRESIEPDIWQARGGEYASVRFAMNRLIINAPKYVHRQIGIPTVARRRPVLSDRRRGQFFAAPGHPDHHGHASRGAISGVGPPSGPISSTY